MLRSQQFGKTRSSFHDSAKRGAFSAERNAIKPWLLIVFIWIFTKEEVRKEATVVWIAGGKGGVVGV